jgi:hypothetical protein
MVLIPPDGLLFNSLATFFAVQVSVVMGFVVLLGEK